jgi:hypothetical protein
LEVRLDDGSELKRAAILPILWISMQVHYRKYLDYTLVGGIDDTPKYLLPNDGETSFSFDIKPQKNVRFNMLLIINS